MGLVIPPSTSSGKSASDRWMPSTRVVTSSTTSWILVARVFGALMRFLLIPVLPPTGRRGPPRRRLYVNVLHPSSRNFAGRKGSHDVEHAAAEHTAGLEGAPSASSNGARRPPAGVVRGRPEPRRALHRRSGRPLPRLCEAPRDRRDAQPPGRARRRGRADRAHRG